MKKTKKSKKNRAVEELKKLYSKTGLITIAYQGSGDAFDSFYDIECFAVNNKNKNLNSFCKTGRPPSTESKKIKSDLDNETSLLSTIIWDAIEKHDEISFNDEGCSGYIKIDLDDEKIIIENTYYVTEGINSEDFVYEDYPVEDSEEEE